jgi:hypothetical protein
MVTMVGMHVDDPHFTLALSSLRAGRTYNELRKVNSCCFSTGLKSRKRLETCLASPRWRVIKSCSVNDLV